MNFKTSVYVFTFLIISSFSVLAKRRKPEQDMAYKTQLVFNYGIGYNFNDNLSHKHVQETE